MCYKSKVFKLRKSGLSDSISNNGPVHAAILSNAIFTGAERYVNIYSGKLNSEVADKPDFVIGIIRLILDGIPVKVILDQFDANDVSLVLQKLILASYRNPGKVQIRLANPHLVEALKNENVIKGHFMFADDKMIRRETCPDNFTAEASFNTDVTLFKEVFSFMFEEGTPLSIPDNVLAAWQGNDI